MAHLRVDNTSSQPIHPSSGDINGPQKMDLLIYLLGTINICTNVWANASCTTLDIWLDKGKLGPAVPAMGSPVTTMYSLVTMNVCIVFEWSSIQLLRRRFSLDWSGALTDELTVSAQRPRCYHGEQIQKATYKHLLTRWIKLGFVTGKKRIRV